jgi:hypothetical protein
MKDIETRINTVKQEHKKLIETEIKTRHLFLFYLKKQKLTNIHRISILIVYLFFKQKP